MKKTIITITTMLLLASCGKKNPKAYQIIVTPEKEYYTTYYTVYHETGCIEFTSYDGDDSTLVKLCEPWDVKRNPDAY